MEVVCPVLGTDLEHSSEVGGSLEAGMIIMNSVLDLLLVALKARTSRVLVSDVVIPFPPPEVLLKSGRINASSPK